MTDEAHQLCERAQHLIDVGRPADAIPLSSRAAALDPSSGRAYCLLAFAHLRLEHHDEARRWAEEAICIDPEDEWGHRVRSVALRLGGHLEESMAPAREAARLAPDTVEALYNLAQSELQTGRLPEARTTSQHLLEVAPENALAHEIAALLADKAGDWADAETHWRRALALNPEEMRYHNNLGTVLLEQGREQEAIDRFHDAVRLEPNAKMFRDNLLLAVNRDVKAALPVVTRVAIIVCWIALMMAWWTGYAAAALAEHGVPFPGGVATVAVALVTWDVAKFAADRVYRKGKREALDPTVREFHAEEEQRELLRRVLGNGLGFSLRLVLLFLLGLIVALYVSQQTPFGWSLLTVPPVVSVILVRLRLRYRLPIFPWQREVRG